jgi:hypothetical protein
MSQRAALRAALSLCAGLVVLRREVKRLGGTGLARVVEPGATDRQDRVKIGLGDRPVGRPTGVDVAGDWSDGVRSHARLMTPRYNLLETVEHAQYARSWETCEVSCSIETGRKAC